jgi:hypothetical protein
MAKENQTVMDPPPPVPRKRCCFIDGNVGYFYPFSSKLRSVISGGADYQLSVTYQVMKHLGVFVSGDFFIQTGESTGSDSDCKLWILPVSLGVRGTYDFWASRDKSHLVMGYASLAPRWYFVEARNYVSYLDKNDFANGFGGMGGLGMAYLYKYLTVNVILQASFGNVHTHTSIPYVATPNTQVGGLVAGGGIGVNF